MLNKTYRKSVLRTVRATMSRFLAIFAIVALGVGFLSGLLASPVDMRLSADNYCRGANLYDIKLQGTQGLNSQNLAAVQAVEGVGQVQPARDLDLVLTTAQGEAVTTRLHSLPQARDENALNQLTLVEGRMPAAPNELVVALLKDFGGDLPQVGDVLTLDAEHNEQTAIDSLPARFTVVGTVRSASYFSIETEYTTAGTGSIGLFAYAPEAAFDMDYYTTFYIGVENARQLNSFSAAYDAQVAAVYDRLEGIKDAQAKLRYDEIIGEAEAELADAWQEYNDKKAEAEQKLADAEAELADGWAELAEGEQELADAQVEITNGQAVLDTNKNEFYLLLPGLKQQISDGYEKIQRTQAQLDEGQALLDEGKAQLAASEAQLNALQQGKEQFWQTVETMGLGGLVDPSDQSDAATIAALQKILGLMALLPPDQGFGGYTPEELAALKEQLPQLKAGLEALAAQEPPANTLEGALAQLAAAKAELDAQQAQINAGRAQLSAGWAELQESEKQLNDTIASTEQAFAQADADLLEARRQYADGLAELADARQALADGQTEYEESKAEAEAELADAEETIRDAESDVREIEKGEWVLLDRGDNASFSSYGDNADKIANIATVFPVFFFLVAALVALTTMTRMVEEERLQVGTLKALGYSRRQIAAKYLLYALAASLAGSVVGMAAGMQIFPRIILSAYNIMYDLPVLYTPFNWQFGLLATAVAVACTLLATLNACGAELREQPASLMLPKAPKAGKRIFLEHIPPLWRRLRFTHKVTARNLFLYKKRFFMTVVGIAGCTALLVTGFGVRDSISDIVSKQFDELAHYQLLVALQDESALEGRDLAAILQDDSQIADFLPVTQEDVTVVPQNGEKADSIYISVPTDVEAMQDYFTFRQRVGGQPVEFGPGAVVVTEKLAERHHLQVGQAITVENDEGKQASFTITGICENYVQHYVYMTAETFEAAFGAAPAPNLLLCKLPQGLDTPQQEDALASALLKCRDVGGAQFTHELTASFSQSLGSINYIVVVLIVAAGALAFVVLYNLTNINITERSKELATIKVLGFYDGEVGAYIYRETAVLTLIGTVCGLAFGVLLHTFVIRTAEVDMVMFGRSIYPLSFVWSALLTVLFSLIVNGVMYRKLKNISMVESMKAPE